MYSFFLKNEHFGNIYFFKKKKTLFEFLSKNIKNSFFNVDRNVYNSLLCCEKKILKNKNFVLDSGERSKHIRNVEKIVNVLIKKGFYKKTKLFSLGGGVVGDITGFVSSIFYRGVELFHIPTTILSQSDSSIGGKNAVNSSLGKNLIGTIYYPKKIFICQEFLYSLDSYHYLMGLSEIIKISLICDPSFFHYIANNSSSIKKKESYVLNYIIKKSVFHKINIIRSDPFDKGNRFCLNFGHTFAHAIESLKEYSINHGEAVFLGLIYSCFFSFFWGKINRKTFLEILNLVKLFYPNIIKNIESINFKKLISFIKVDKKKVSRKKIKFIFIDRIGSFFFKKKNPNELKTIIPFIKSELVNLV
ncbi:3-dehydroquinate synthase [Candidatus Vidania fulgoroideae]|nr:3-dehydroquinate synthase [Candidatus Vidania fulgoroideae]